MEMINDIVIKPVSKKELEVMAKKKIDSLIEEGEFTLHHMAILKRAEHAVKTMLEASKKEAILLRDHWNSKEKCIVDGVEFSYYSMPDSLDFESDAEYKRIKDEIDSVTAPLFAAIEERKEMLKDAYKMAQKGLELITDQGELIKPPKVLKPGSEVLKSIY